MVVTPLETKTETQGNVIMSNTQVATSSAPSNVGSMPSGFTKRANGDIMDVNRQWASRPADEAVFSVDDLLARTKLAQQRSTEVMGVQWADLSVVADGERLLLSHNGGVSSKAFSNYSMQQFCMLPTNDGDTIAPQSFISKLPAKLAAECLNDRLSRGIARTGDAQFMVRENDIRCVTTERYERVWDFELAERVAKLSKSSGWGPAQAFKTAESSNRQAWGNASKQAPLPLSWVGDRSMFICMVDYDGAIEHEGNQYARFFLLSNSEVGAAALKVTFGLLDFVCCNMILWGCHEVYEASFKHTKSVHERCWAALSKGFDRSLESGERDSIVRGIDAARAYLIGDSEEQVVAVTRAATDLPKNLVVDAYARAAATPRYGSPNTVWGMVNGLTEASQASTQHADKRTAIDAKAARLMGLLKR